MWVFFNLKTNINSSYTEDANNFCESSISSISIDDLATVPNYSNFINISTNNVNHMKYNYQYEQALSKSSYKILDTIECDTVKKVNMNDYKHPYEHQYHHRNVVVCDKNENSEFTHPTTPVYTYTNNYNNNIETNWIFEQSNQGSKKDDIKTCIVRISKTDQNLFQHVLYHIVDDSFELTINANDKIFDLYLQSAEVLGIRVQDISDVSDFSISYLIYTLVSYTLFIFK